MKANHREEFLVFMLTFGLVYNDMDYSGGSFLSMLGLFALNTISSFILTVLLFMFATKPLYNKAVEKGWLDK